VVLVVDVVVDGLASADVCAVVVASAVLVVLIVLWLQLLF